MAQVFYATLISFQTSAFSACYKQLKVLHLKHPCLISFPCTLAPAASCTGVLMKWGLHPEGLKYLRLGKSQFDTTQTQQNTRQSCCHALFLPILLFFSLLFFTLSSDHVTWAMKVRFWERDRSGGWAENAMTTESVFLDNEYWIRGSKEV